MTIVICLLIVILFVIIGFSITIIKKIKVSKDYLIQSNVDTLSTALSGESNIFSQKVLNLYYDILKDPNQYILSQHILKKNDSSVAIWAANDLVNRRFYTLQSSQEEKVRNLNKTLTYYDKVLLDKIVESYRNRQSKLVAKFFI